MRGDTKTYFHLGGSRIVSESEISVSAQQTGCRLELQLAAGGRQLTLELHPRPRDLSAWEGAKDAMKKAVQEACR